MCHSQPDRLHHLETSSLSTRLYQYCYTKFLCYVVPMETVLQDIANTLGDLGVNVGATYVSLLSIVKAILLFAFLMWISYRISKRSETLLKRVDQFSPSLQVLFSKVIKITLIFLTIVITLSTLGIDLTGLAVFSGAVGVGLGFGLQKVVSNFISGIILLLDRSIKPGDVVVVEDTYGWVNSLGARCISIITRDGKEHLIPNELFITEKVENWSYTNNNIRLKIPVGISYANDPRKALELMLKVADENERILKVPKPNALVIGFGDSSIDLELRAWINDPANGVRNITSEILLGIWDAFKENDIKIPFPQRDLHLKSVDKSIKIPA